MKTLALITDAVSLPIDYDMPLLLDACQENGFKADICQWEDSTIDWSQYDAVLLRSPWNCIDRLSDFITCCEQIAAVTHLFNPVSVARWALNKCYLADLATYGIPIVPSTFVAHDTNSFSVIKEFFNAYPDAREIVIKPTVGSYSRGVQRYTRSKEVEAAEHIKKLLGQGCQVILQPYFDSIDHYGETDLIYFDGVYSHAIRKSALLMPDGTVNVPTLDFRKSRVADDDEHAVASAALTAAALHLNIKGPLLYGRVDLIRDNNNQPMVLELDICEPSLNLPFSEDGATRLLQALSKRLKSAEKVERIG